MPNFWHDSGKAHAPKPRTGALAPRARKCFAGSRYKPPASAGVQAGRRSQRLYKPRSQLKRLRTWGRPCAIPPPRACPASPLPTTDGTRPSAASSRLEGPPLSKDYQVEANAHGALTLGFVLSLPAVPWLDHRLQISGSEQIRTESTQIYRLMSTNVGRCRSRLARVSAKVGQDSAKIGRVRPNLFHPLWPDFGRVHSPKPTRFWRARPDVRQFDQLRAKSTYVGPNSANFRPDQADNATCPEHYYSAKWGLKPWGWTSISPAGVARRPGIPRYATPKVWNTGRGRPAHVLQSPKHDGCAPHWRERLADSSGAGGAALPNPM